MRNQEMEQNGAATEQEFREQWTALDAGEPVKLPKSGLTVYLRRLAPTRAIAVLDEIEQIDPQFGLSVEEFRALPEEVRLEIGEARAQFDRVVASCIRDILAKPKFTSALAGYMPREDFYFIYKWGMGVVAPDGSDLARTFRVEGEAAGAGGARQGAESKAE